MNGADTDDDRVAIGPVGPADVGAGFAELVDLGERRSGVDEHTNPLHRGVLALRFLLFGGDLLSLLEVLQPNGEVGESSRRRRHVGGGGVFSHTLTIPMNARRGTY